jgi:hypothetical protein
MKAWKKVGPSGEAWLKGYSTLDFALVTGWVGLGHGLGRYGLRPRSCS